MGVCMNYQGLNQEKQLWQELENYILNSAHARIQSLHRHRSVYTDRDPVLKEQSVRVPLEFWKVVVMEDSERNKLRRRLLAQPRAADP